MTTKNRSAWLRTHYNDDYLTTVVLLSPEITRKAGFFQGRRVDITKTGKTIRVTANSEGSNKLYNNNANRGARTEGQSLQVRSQRILTQPAKNQSLRVRKVEPGVVVLNLV